MPEATADAAILIAASYQAMNRAAAGDLSTQLCDCTVTVAFAGFYIEANLNHLIAELGRESDFRQAYGPNAGLKSKLAFLYIEYIASAPVAKKDVYDRLEVEFPGITELANFRNDICHGTMNQTVAQSLAKTLELRQRAKDIAQPALYSCQRQDRHRPAANTRHVLASARNSTTSGILRSACDCILD
jgi:hypothetical protein